MYICGVDDIDSKFRHYYEYLVYESTDKEEKEAVKETTEKVSYR
jgi:hypothetical protein